MSNLGNNLSKEYDVCLLSISDISSDARTLNIAKTLSKHNKSIAIIAFGKDEVFDSLKEYKIDFFKISNFQGLRAKQRWKHFNNEITKYLDLKADIYWAGDFFTLSATNKFSRKYNAPFFYDSREIYSRIASLSNSPIRQFIQTQLEKHWVKNASKIIVSGELDAEYLKEHFKLDVPYYVIMNLPPFRERVNSDLFREKYSIAKEQKIILYQGMLMKGRGIIPIIEALPHLENCVFCLLGTGDYQETIKKKAIEMGVQDRVFLCGNVGYDELHQWTCSADIGNCFIEPVSFSNELALPNKLFEYIMAGIPSLVSDLPAMKKVVDEYQVGKCVSRNSAPKALAEAIEEILLEENNKKYKEYSKTASKIFCYENQEKTILKIFEDLK